MSRGEAAGTILYKGVSLAGAEFGVDPYGAGAVPGTFGVNYMYPDATYVAGYTSPDHFLATGMNTFRLPFRWERLQPARHAAFDAAELSRLTTTVNHLTAKGATVVLDPHNYARYGASLIGSAAVPNSDFADLWTRLATTFKGNSKVIFGLMNEPHDMSTEQWVSAANAAIVAIRQTGAQNLILVPGNGWDGAGGWSQNWYGTANATAMLSITDSGNNFAFEVHQYLDADSSGSNQTCASATAGSQAMQGFTSWLRANNKRAFLGEFGAASNATCLAGLDDLVKHLEANADVYLGWTYWAAGPWWGVNWMAIEPVNGADVPQMTTLLPHLAAAPQPPSCQTATYDSATMFHSIGAATTGGWNLYSNGYTSTNHNFVSGQTKITVTAGGSSAAGVWPHMVVTVDGATVGSTNITAAAYTDYAFPVSVSAGTHEIRVTFDNDYCTTTEDRNLFVAKVAVGCGAGAPPPPAATCTDGIKNGNETGVDCGGSCAACPTCSDGIKNGNETGVDCGGSCAPCQAPACSPKTYSAATMTHSLGSATVDGWNLWSDGYASTNHTFTGGTTTITVNAQGSIAGGVWPHMVVSVGGTVIGTTSVQSASYTAYPFTFQAAAGTQEIRVAFDNDYCTQTEDRNLYLKDVTVSCGSGAPVQQQPPPVQQPPAGTIRVMPLGDSITLGVNGGYRNGLWTRLTGAGKTVDYVGSQSDQYTVAPDHDHEGHPGFTIGNIASSADSWVASAAPTHVLLMIGTNDVAWWCAQTGSQVADLNAALIDQLLADLPSAWIIVSSIPPLSSSIIQPNNVDRAQLGKDYNVALKQRVQDRINAGKRVRWADAYSVLTVADLYDGVHPTQVAADKVAQVWFDAMSPTLP